MLICLLGLGDAVVSLGIPGTLCLGFARAGAESVSQH